MFEGFTTEEIDTGNARIFVRHCWGDGPPIMLLHGHPRTSATWHRVAPMLRDGGFSVICPDLRGYGRSIGPDPAGDHSAHSKRAVAADMLAVAHRLGHETFSLAGHDRGSYVALRLALDHPEVVQRLALMDCVPISEHLRDITPEFATAWWHWFFFAQPEIPERVINADPVAWYRPKADPATMGHENHAELMNAVHNPSVVRAMLEDYRAGLTIDRADEEADMAAGRRLGMRTLILWSSRDDLEQLHGDPLAIWRRWTENVSGFRIESRHHMAEEAPEEVAAALSAFFA
ncbi:alpha/beta hydrolase [Microbacterium sp.]|uniref:alpha/beta hydrolase n=1 Tax=Microbacterium sp. TaxID=51671 RepID=UPI0028125F06|nr:alpha/beta hydrolase [Microbacterium sp.]